MYKTAMDFMSKQKVTHLKQQKSRTVILPKQHLADINALLNRPNRSSLYCALCIAAQCIVIGPVCGGRTAGGR